MSERHSQQTGAYVLVQCEICGEMFPVVRRVGASAKYCPDCRRLDCDFGSKATLARRERRRRLAERDREIERTSPPVKVTVEERGGWIVETRGQRIIAPRVPLFGGLSAT